MAKGQNNKKSSKKKPQKTMKEKKQAKREKKNQNSENIINWDSLDYYTSIKSTPEKSGLLLNAGMRIIWLPWKERKMENYITCPSCNKTLSNDPIIEAAARKDYTESRSITCECGEKITYWNIVAQLRTQKTLKFRLRAWLRSFSQAQS